jgi:hypothetical protein
MLLWRMVDLNKVSTCAGAWNERLTHQRFRAYLLESGKAGDLVAYVLLHCLEMKDDPCESLPNQSHLACAHPSAHHGLLRLLSYLLQTLSVEQAFATVLNQPMRLGVPSKWAVQGSTADFLIVVRVALLLPTWESA